MTARRTRVLVVDDSAFARKVVREILSREADLEVVGVAHDGLDAVEKIGELRPDVVTLDLVMPGLDGVGVLDALAALAAQRAQGRPEPPPPHVVVVTSADDESPLGVAALAAGAFDVVHKPTAIATDRLYDLDDDLVAKVRAAAAAPRGTKRDVDVEPRGPALAARPAALSGKDPAVDLVVMGASTGGPPAIAKILAALPRELPVPIAIVLHMPAGYTAAFADRVDRDSALDVFEARDALELLPGRVALARAGMHLRLERAPGSRIAVTRLDVSPVDSAHRPSVDVLFASAAATFGARVLGVVLTGMGDDGVAGARALRAQGAPVIVESEASCVVYGMPRSVWEAGLAEAQVPLAGMPRAILERIAGR